MKSIFVVIDKEQDGKHFAFAETICTGENLVPFIERYKPCICHLCETRKQAEEIALHWNETYRQNGTNLY